MCYERVFLPNEIVQGDIYLTTDSGRSWKVKILKNLKRYYITTGWSEVVHDLALPVDTIIVFKLIDPKHFNITWFYKDRSIQTTPSFYHVNRLQEGTPSALVIIFFPYN